MKRHHFLSSATTSAVPSACSKAGSINTEPGKPTRNLRSRRPRLMHRPRLMQLATGPARSRRSATRPATRPIRSRHPSPKFSAIRQTGLHQTKIHTPLIWENMRSEFGAAQRTLTLDAPRRLGSGRLLKYKSGSVHLFGTESTERLARNNLISASIRSYLALSKSPILHRPA
jgi:hypothetical protein